MHAGLICLNGPAGMDLDLQLEMFEEALDELDRDDDLVNQVLEISLSDSSEEFEVLRYQLRAPNQFQKSVRNRRSDPGHAHPQLRVVFYADNF